MYLEEIDGIIYIDNLPSLSPNMEVSFIKKKFSIFSLSLQIFFVWNFFLTVWGGGYKTNQEYI